MSPHCGAQSLRNSSYFLGVLPLPSSPAPVREFNQIKVVRAMLRLSRRKIHAT